MSLPEAAQSVCIQLNRDTQCYEAWAVFPDTGERLLVATCSACVSDPELQWWEQRVWNEWTPSCSPRNRSGAVGASPAV